MIRYILRFYIFLIINLSYDGSIPSTNELPRVTQHIYFQKEKMFKLYKKILFLHIIVVLSSCSGLEKNIQLDETWKQQIDFWISFPPVSNAEQRNFTKNHLDNLHVKNIRIGEDWTFRESQKWTYNWSPLDQRINWAINNNYKVFLTLQSRWPDWACSDVKNEKSCVYKNDESFWKYLKALAQRYSWKIDYIQFWNEWQSTFWYAGTAQQYVIAHNEVYNTFKKYAPDTKIVLWWFTTISLRYLSACYGNVDKIFIDTGEILQWWLLEDICKSEEVLSTKKRIDTVMSTAQFDLIDLHLYDDYYNWQEYVENIRQLYWDFKIIVSEFWWPNLNMVEYSEGLQANELKEYMLSLNNLDIESAYYFTLVEWNGNEVHLKSWLINEAWNTKKSYSVFELYNKK